ncbi:MAG TPA: DegT/DnrJ/EryC1/StrS family aminotransferase [bacterium]|jgi:dTDP-4-amino-4,6-dideoxygalactose transaminase
MNVPMLDLPAQFRKIQGEVMPEITRIFETQYFILGPNVKKIEEQMAGLAGMKCGIGASSGTDALLLSLMAINIRPGDEVITTPYTFVATTEAIVRTGGTPVFVDIEKDSFNLDVKQAEAAITPRTRALLPVHLFGLVIDPDAWRAVAQKHKVTLIEDAAQAVGAKRKTWVAGGIGDISAFSFYPTKNLGGAGDGGMVLTRTDELAATVRSDRMHGGHDRYYYDRLGICARLDEIQAAVLAIKFKYLGEWNERRRALATLYNHLLEGAPVTMQAVPADAYHTYHQYVIRAPRRDDLKEYLKTRGIASDIYYPVPLHLQECYGYLGYKQGQFPNAESLALDSLALPINAELSDAQVEFVAKSIQDFYRGVAA